MAYVGPWVSPISIWRSAPSPHPSAAASRGKKKRDEESRDEIHTRNHHRNRGEPHGADPCCTNDRHPHPANRATPDLRALLRPRRRGILRGGPRPQAVDDYSQAIRLRLDNPEPWIGRARAYIALQRPSPAIDDLDQALRLDPNALTPHVERGYAYGQQGLFDRAVSDFSFVIARSPTDARALSLRGAALARLGQNEKALADREAVVKLLPNSAEAYEARGGSYHELGMHEKGLADRTKAIELNPNFEQGWLARGSAYFLLERYDEATRDLTEALRLKPDDNEAKLVLSKIPGNKLFLPRLKLNPVPASVEAPASANGKARRGSAEAELHRSPHPPVVAGSLRQRRSPRPCPPSP